MKKLKIKLHKPNEWGNYIHPDTLEVKDIVGEIPEKSIIIIKKKEFRSELSRSVIVTRYATISKGVLMYLSKTDASKKLAKLCATYMLRTKHFPPKVTVSGIKSEKKPVELVFTHTTSDTFQLLITEELLQGKNPYSFIENLIASSDKKHLKEQSEIQWIINKAPHGRGMCIKCKKQIKAGELRFKEMDSKDSIMNPDFYHYACFPFAKYEKETIHGIKDLTEEDQRKIRKTLKL